MECSWYAADRVPFAYHQVRSNLLAIGREVFVLQVLGANDEVFLVGTLETAQAVLLW